MNRRTFFAAILGSIAGAKARMLRCNPAPAFQGFGLDAQAAHAMVSMAEGIVRNLKAAHMETSLMRIERSTRETAAMVDGADRT